MLSFNTVIEILGWAGVILYVIAYYLVSAGKLSGRSARYQNLNLVGAFGVAVNAFYYGAYPSAIVNVIWFVIAATTLLGVIRPSDETDPAQPESVEGRTVHKILFFTGGVLAVFGLALAVITLSPRPPRPLQPVLVFTQEWPPYVDRSRPDGGPVGALVREVFRGTGYDAQLRFTDWDDAIAQVEAGVAAAAFPFIDSRDRAERVDSTEPLLHFDYVLFYRRGLTAPDGRTGEDALHAWLEMKSGAPGALDAEEWDEPWKLGAVEGYALWPALAEVASVDARFDTPEEAFRSLERGEIHMLAEGKLVGLHIIQDPATGVDASMILPVERDGPLARSAEALRLVTRATGEGRALRDRLNDRLAELFRRGDLRTLERRLDALTRTEVRMHSTAEVVHRELGERRVVAAGTRAVVLCWPAGFDRIGEPGRGTDVCKVRILNGPLRGWEVLVPPESFEIVAPSVDP